MSNKILYFSEKLKSKYNNNFTIVGGQPTSYKSKITIKCAKHDHCFETTVTYIMQKQGCKFCKSEVISNKAKDKRDAYVKKLLEDYKHIKVLSLSPVKMKSKFECLKHSKIFENSLDSIKRKNFIGCPVCTSEDFSKRHIENIEDMMLDKLKTYPSLFKYSYHKSRYNGWGEKVIITCLEHGDYSVGFVQRSLGEGSGECRKCMVEKSRESRLNDFIKKANELHGNQYGYDDIKNYTNCKKPVSIFCKKCKDYFLQTADNHLQGKGCNSCNRISIYVKNHYAKVAKIKYGGLCSIYLIKCYNQNEEFYKVGVTLKKINTRFASKYLMPYSYEIIKEIRSGVDGILNFEDVCHKSVALNHYKPNIYFGGSVTECFSIGGLEGIKKLFIAFERDGGYKS